MKADFNMKRLTSVILCIAISFFVYMYLCMILIPKEIGDAGGELYYRGKGFMAEPENTLDMVVFGNSDVYSGFSPQVMYEKHGLTSYASGRANQTMGNIVQLLDSALETQNPKIVILETDCFYSVDKGMNYMDSVFTAPFIYHSRWKEIKKRDFYNIPDRTGKMDVNKGFIPSKIIYEATYSPDYMGHENSLPEPVPEENVKYIKQFIKTCKRNGTKVVFLELPSPSSWNYARHNAVKNIAEKHDIEFIDLNVCMKNPEIDKHKDFRDNGNHLNIYGAAKCTEYIGDYLMNFHSQNRACI